MALITIGEAAKMCGVSSQTILNWAERGIITIQKHKGASKRKWWHVNKEQIDEICGVSQDIQETKKILEQELEGLKDTTRKVIQQRKEALLDLGLLNTTYMSGSISLLLSIVEMACKCGTINMRQAYVLKRFINGSTFEEVSDDMVISRERIRQIFEIACRKIKKASNIVEKLNDYDFMKSEYETIKESGKMLQKENDKLRERLEIKKREERLKTLQERKNYLDETDDICKILSKNLKDCDLSVRALNCLKYADIKTVGDLVQYAKRDLLKFRNFGKKSLTELDDFIEENNLHWSMDVEKFYLERAKLYFVDDDEELVGVGDEGKFVEFVENS